MKLNLGCGNDYREGYINCDCTNDIKIDEFVDLEKPLDMFEDNSIDEIICFHVLEHIKDIVPLIHELHRISKGGSLIKIKTPFYSSWGQYNDPTHVRFFTPFTFDYFNKGNYSHEVISNEQMFKSNKVKINFGVGPSSKLNFLFNPLINLNHKVYCRFFAWLIPSSEIDYELEVIK